MTGLWKIVGIGLFGVIAAAVVRKDNEPLALAMVVAVVMLVFSFALSAMNTITTFVGDLAKTAGLSGTLVTPVLKCVGLAIVTKIAADLCRDAREGAVSSIIEFSGTVIALYTILPLISRVLQLVSSLF